MSSPKTIRVLFVCLGNICRSPMAEAIFQKLVEDAGLEDRFEIASAATSHWEIGSPPHPGTQAVLRKHNIRVRADKRAVQISAADLYYYDYVVAMDSENLADLSAFGQKKVYRLLDFAPQGSPRDVPDPYYTRNFDYVYQLVEAGCAGLLAHIRQQENL
jgi:protein-tyrosine phosphatase